MKDEAKTREELISELIELRNQVSENTKTEQEYEIACYELQKYKIFSDNAFDLVYFCDTLGNILYVNRIFEKLTGHKPEDFEGKSFAPLFDEENLKKAMDVYAKTLKGEAPEYELLFRSTGVLCEYRNFPFRNKEGEIIGVVGIARDVTERRKREQELDRYREYLEELAAQRSEELEKKILAYQQAEEAKEILKSQLLHSQKMDAIGRLAGGIAHDFNNILTAIKNFSYIGIKSTSGKDNETAGIFEQIQSVSFRAINLTRQLLTFSQKEISRIIRVDVNRVINDMIAMLHHLIGENITITTNLDANLWTIRGDAGKLEQVLTNLIVNSREAMPDGGIITIESRNLIIKEEDCLKIPYSRTGRFIIMNIEDTGTGIPSEDLEHIFEPFFTTRKIGSNSGLGLSVVYGIIKEHEGWINVFSNKETGTRFNIYLPAEEIVE